MTGNMKDEGTLFALITCLNTTTDDEFEDYFRTYWWPHITGDQMQKLMDLYPNDPTQGSPFDTGLANSLFMFKRLSALIGDYSFQVSYFVRINIQHKERGKKGKKENGEYLKLIPLIYRLNAASSLLMHLTRRSTIILLNSAFPFP